MMSKSAMPVSLLTQSWVQAGRLLIRWRRDRTVLVGSLMFPICILLVYQVVLGERVRTVTGVESVYGLVPLCALLSALFGAFSTSAGIGMERDSGLLSRMWVLPVHRASALTGRVTAEAVRTLLATVMLTILGIPMGLRFADGWLTACAYIMIPIVVVVGFTALVMAVAVRSKGSAVMTWLAMGAIALAFVNPGTTPIGLYPEWFQPFVRMQPLSPPIEAMWALANGGPLLWPIAGTFLWTFVLLAVFMPIAVRGYRQAAESNA